MQSEKEPEKLFHNKSIKLFLDKEEDRKKKTLY